MSFKALADAAQGFGSFANHASWKLKDPGMLNAINDLSLTTNAAIALAYYKRERGIRRESLPGKINGYYRDGETDIVIDSKLDGTTAEGAAYLAAVLSHENDHLEGNKVEALANMRAQGVYNQILEQRGLTGDSTLLKYFADSIASPAHWQENSGNRHYMEFEEVLEDPYLEMVINGEMTPEEYGNNKMINDYIRNERNEMNINFLRNNQKTFGPLMFPVHSETTGLRLAVNERNYQTWNDSARLDDIDGYYSNLLYNNDGQIGPFIPTPFIFGSNSDQLQTSFLSLNLNLNNLDKNFYAIPHFVMTPELLDPSFSYPDPDMKAGFYDPDKALGDGGWNDTVGVGTTFRWNLDDTLNPAQNEGNWRSATTASFILEPFVGVNSPQ